VVKRFVVVLGAVTTFVVAVAVPASAHVAIDPASAPKGAEAVTLAFNVPNEKDNATTTKVEIVLPEGKPLTFVSAEPIPGWQVATQKTKLATPVTSEEGDVTEAVSRVTWSGGTIGAGQFQQFVLRVGPLPDDADSLEFKALQTYSDGEVVRWIEATPAGGAEPDHPAPTLELTAAESSANGGHTDTAVDPAAAAAVRATDDDSNGLAIAALVVGVVALLVGAGALLRGLRSSST
jgi:uncharacterized protein YcnI